MSRFIDFVSKQASNAGTAAAIEAAAACLDRFTERFNARDIKGVDAELHFPHTMLGGAARIDWPAPGAHPTNFFDTLKATGWHRTRYESKQPVLASADKVHFVVIYTRRDAADAILSTHENLWIVACLDGRWGICLRSY